MVTCTLVSVITQGLMLVRDHWLLRLAVLEVTT